jgi:hypothetical protein
MRPAVVGHFPLLLVEDGCVNEREVERVWPGKVLYYRGTPPILLEIVDQTAVVLDLEQLCAGQ